MDIKLEQISNVEAKIVVSIAETDYATKVDEKLKEFGKTHAIPGFRKGMVPLKELKKRYGRQMKSDVINQVVYDAVIDYIKENKLAVIGSPLPVEVKEIDLKAQDYTFEYEVGLAPEINVKIDKDVELPFYEIEITDEMIAEQDKQFCERFGEQTTGDTVDAKAVVKGSIMELNPDGTVKETEDAIQVVSGIVAPFTFKSKEEADKFMGKHVDDKVDFNPWATCDGDATELSSMLQIDKEAAANVKADFRFTISEIMVLKPAEHNQDLYDNVFGKDKVTDEAGYLDGIRNMIAAQLQRNSFQLFARDAQEWLYRAFGNFDLPEEFIKKLLAHNYPELAADPERLELETKGSIGHLRWDLLTDAACRTLDVKLTEDDMKERAELIARQQFAQYGIYNMDDETVASMAQRFLSDDRSRQRIANDIREDKLCYAISQAVTLKNETVSMDRFRELAQAQTEPAE